MNFSNQPSSDIDVSQANFRFWPTADLDECPLPTRSSQSDKEGAQNRHLMRSCTYYQESRLVHRL